MEETLSLAHLSVSPSLSESPLASAKPCLQGALRACQLPLHQLSKLTQLQALPDPIPPPSRESVLSQAPACVHPLSPVKCCVVSVLAAGWRLCYLRPQSGQSWTRQELGGLWLLSKVLTGIRPRMCLVTPSGYPAGPSLGSGPVPKPLPPSSAWPPVFQWLPRFGPGTEGKRNMVQCPFGDGQGHPISPNSRPPNCRSVLSTPAARALGSRSLLHREVWARKGQ